MKKSKVVRSIIAHLLSIAIITALLPVWRASAANIILFVEDFEDYDVGVIVEAEEDQTTATRIGNIEFVLKTGDKLEIAEENGNKYLKFKTLGKLKQLAYQVFFPRNIRGRQILFFIRLHARGA